MRRNTIYLYVVALAAAVTVAVVSAGLSVSAQNSNSSMTMTEQPKPKPKPAGRCDPNEQEQTDLSGTYTGKMKHGDGPAQDATMTISGNSVTVASGSETHTGRITAVTTCGYTAVTIMHGDGGASVPGQTTPMNKVISLRAKRAGNSMTLMSVPGEPEKVMFTSGGGAGRPRRQGTRPPAAKPATTPQQ